MAAAVTELWRSVSPDEIDTTLPDLWMTVAREHPVSRALLSNLVVVSQHSHSGISGSGTPTPASEIVAIAERHPARIILLNYVPTAASRTSLGNASLGVLTYGAASGRYGVEVIAVEAMCAAPSVPSIVRHLTRGDVPTTVWWTPDLSRIRPPDALVQTGRQLLYDSATWDDPVRGLDVAAALLTVSPSPDIADLNWRRLAPLRTAFVKALRHEPEPVGPVTGATVSHAGSERPAARLIAAWLKDGLDTAPVAIEEVGEGAQDRVRITLVAGGRRMTAALKDDRIVVESKGRPATNVPVPALSTADAVVAELRALGRDQQLRRTLETASRRNADD